jgi:hypothetical protein
MNRPSGWLIKSLVLVRSDFLSVASDIQAARTHVSAKSKPIKPSTLSRGKHF